MGQRDHAERPQGETARVDGPAASPARGLQRLQSALGNRAIARLAETDRLTLLRAASADPAALGARAYTVGTDVGQAAHTVRQRSRAAALRDPLRVGRAIQRDLIKTHRVAEGRFKLKLTTESNPGGKSGMKGTIKFTPNASAPDSMRIKLYQVVRNEDPTTGADWAWSGDDAPLGAMATVAHPDLGIEGGWHIDHIHTDARAKVRTKLSDPQVSPYYRDYAPNSTASYNGLKQGDTIGSASLFDAPAWDDKMRWSFETIAKATDTGHVYGAVTWGFTLSDPAAGTITGERSDGHDAASATADAALRRFDEYYRNPGSTTAPTT